MLESVYGNEIDLDEEFLLYFKHFGPQILIQRRGAN